MEEIRIFGQLIIAKNQHTLLPNYLQKGCTIKRTEVSNQSPGGWGNGDKQREACGTESRIERGAGLCGDGSGKTNGVVMGCVAGHLSCRRTMIDGISLVQCTIPRLCGGCFVFAFNRAE